MPTRSRGRNPPPSNNEQVTSKTPSCTLLTHAHTQDKHTQTPHPHSDTNSRTHWHTPHAHETHTLKTHSLHNTILNIQRRRTHARITKQQTLLALRTYGVALQSKRTFSTNTNANTNMIVKRLQSNRTVQKKTSCLCGGHITGAPICQLKSGAANLPLL